MATAPASVAAQRARARIRDIPDPPDRPTASGVDPIRPAQTVAYAGWTVLVCAPDGSIGNGEAGLYDQDCRIMSQHHLTLDGDRPQPVGSPLAEAQRWCGYLRLARPGGTPEGPQLPQDTWAITIERRVGPGMSERISIDNASMVESETTLALELDADFVDALTRGRTSGGIERSTAWSESDGVIVARSLAEANGRTDERGLRIRFEGGDPPHADVPRLESGVRLEWPIRLAPHGRWSIELVYGSLVGGEWREPSSNPQRAALRDGWATRRTRIETPGSIVGTTVERAADDLGALRSWDLEPSRDGSAWLPNAGVPWFTGLFGRDVLTTGWQAALAGPELLRGSLAVVASTQGRRHDAFTEERPGRMLHELRHGPLGQLGLKPHARYYGTQTTGSMFLLALSEAWHWTGDMELLHRHRAAAQRTIEWAERFGDLDGDGFLEYGPHSPKGLKNQGWKDSNEAIRGERGELIDNPIATVEEQAFHYLALQRMAEVLVALDEQPDEVERLLRRAAALRDAWDRVFWLEDEGFYALALGPDKEPVRTIASNPLHALGTGIVPAAKAEAVADRLMSRDLFSGWGIRTLSAEHPSFNPLAYHLGAVWPVENATAAVGFKRYGLDDHVERLCAGLFGAAAHCRDLRLPEALSGIDRDDIDRPVPYPGACSPQAWSASATIQLVQAMLGLYPFAPAAILGLVRPRLPAWLPELTLRRLRVGSAVVTLRFERTPDGSAEHRVLEQDGPLRIVPAPPPNASDVSPLEGLARFALDHVPGGTARALRIALGLDDGGSS